MAEEEKSKELKCIELIDALFESSNIEVEANEEPEVVEEKIESSSRIGKALAKFSSVKRG